MSSTPAGDIDTADRHLLQRRAAELATPVEVGRNQGEPHIVVRAAGRQVAIPAPGVRHVAVAPVVTPVPGSPAALVGVAAVMGELVATTDLNALLDRTASPTQRRHVVVVEDGEEMLGLLVETIDEVRLLDLPASTEPGAPGDGLLRQAWGDLHLLDLDALRSDPRLSSTANVRPRPHQGTR